MPFRMPHQDREGQAEAARGLVLIMLVPGSSTILRAVARARVRGKSVKIAPRNRLRFRLLALTENPDPQETKPGNVIASSLLTPSPHGRSPRRTSHIEPHGKGGAERARLVDGGRRCLDCLVVPLLLTPQQEG
eukprot:7389688-Prymnesium_polylepis.1